jgi:hypothetical protein
MSTPISTLASWDLFFFYGQNDIALEIESDLMQLLLQRSRTMYYNNQESGGISNYENYPNEINLQINARYDIANAVSWKNTQIADGRNNLPDRRIAVSQSSINFKKDNKGNLDVFVLYIPYANYTAYNTLNPTIPGLR